MLPADQIRGERESVIGSAMSWLGTPYHHMGEVKGSGCDCITFLHCSFRQAHIGITPEPLPFYPQDWHLHRDYERYVEGLMQYCVEMPPDTERTPKPADILVFQFGRAYSHGALVVDYPNLLHCYLGVGVERTSLLDNVKLTAITERGFLNGQPRPRKVFTLKRWVE